MDDSSLDSLLHPCTTTAWTSEAEAGGEGKRESRGEGGGARDEDEAAPIVVVLASAAPLIRHASRKASSRAI